VDSFRFYPINKGTPYGAAVAVGRYAEDVYYGGNPWYLTTLAAAEQLYDALYVWKQEGSLSVTLTSLGFFRDMVPTVDLGVHSATTSTFKELCDAVLDYADGFVDFVRIYVEPDGSMAEQFDKYHGRPMSARDLTWSYAAFLTAAARRKEAIPAPWGAALERPVPSVCFATSVVGSYAFPTSQIPVPPTKTRPVTTTNASKPSRSSSTGCATATSVTVTFNEFAVTTYGDTMKLVGDIDALGNWDPNAAVPLEASRYTSTNPLWKTTLKLKAGEIFQYKYINVGQDGSIRWEADPNHTYTVPANCATAVVRTDKWQNLG
jgi:glucoamylase